MRVFQKHIFLFLSLLTLGLSLFFYSIIEWGAISATDKKYLNTLQERIKKELLVSETELKTIEVRVHQSKGYSFASLQAPTVYPYFIFRNHRLLFWSDYRLIPEYKALVGKHYPGLVSLLQGEYLVNRISFRKGRDSLEIVSLINLYRRYQYENNYLRSGYNPSLFTQDPKEISTSKGAAYQNMYSAASNFLFSVVPPGINAFHNQTSSINTVILATLSVIFMGVYLIRRTIKLRQNRHYGAGFVILALYLLVLRSVMLYFGVPFLFVDTDLFNPKFYVSSALAPSLGDLLLNGIVVAALALYVVNMYYRSRSYSWLLRQPDWLKIVVAIIVVLLSYGVFFECLQELNSLYENARFTLDITLSIAFPPLKVACLAIFITISTIYFLLTHICCSLFIRLAISVPKGIAWFVVGTALALLIFWVMDRSIPWINVLHGTYFLVLYLSRFPRSLYTFRYRTSLYLFLATIVCAALATYVVYHQELRKDITNKREFGQKLLAENDEFGEFLLGKSRNLIGRDAEISRSLISDTLLVQERILQRVKRLHLDNYFERYDIDVLPFDQRGRYVENPSSSATYQWYTEQYQTDKFRTKYPGLYFINEAGNRFIKQYVQFVSLQQNGRLVGHLIINLKLRNESPKSIYPSLLVDKKFYQAPETRAYSYAIYSPLAKIQSTDGSYNYERKIPASLLKDPKLYEEGISYNAYRHVGQRGKNGQTVIVSSTDYPLRNIFSNFSFLYLLLILYGMIVIIIYAFRYGWSRFQLDYSTKVQILLNVAFFLPLVLVVVITLGVISSNYDTNQENTYLNTTKNIASNFLPHLRSYQAKTASKEYMESELRKIAQGAQLDINVFTRQGQLYATTQPMMYEGGHLSKYINPEAYIHLIEDKENQVLLTESLGTKRYRTAYVSIKSYDGQVLGILSIPHFESQPELDRQLIEVISTALSVFTGLFLVFLLVSYWASNILTGPLKLITQKIRRTNLDKLNEKLEYQSDDEIGLLIGAYNRMLEKLEESKRALSHSEKQSAWREMAKQVAHEIKNPLTPMKLTLQHLQRILPRLTTDPVEVTSENPNARRSLQTIQRTIDTLLDQIDNLSDIATSFSDFAKMPLPKNDLFEITAVINKAADLYADDEKIILKRMIVPFPVMVIGDRQLIGRILTNLIINAIQSVPADRKPLIQLRLAVGEETVNVEVRDNGTGIPEAIRSKVFLPNFSTKQGGSGLGLAIAKRGVEHAGGTIWFETVVGEGTSFFITLPLVSSPDMINGKGQVKAAMNET